MADLVLVYRSNLTVCSVACSSKLTGLISLFYTVMYEIKSTRCL